MSYLAEKHIIGSLLMDKDCMNNIYSMLEPEMFTSEILGKVYHEYQRAFDRGYVLTLPMIEQKLSSDNFPSDLIMEELRACLADTITSAEVAQNADVLVNAYKARRLDKMLSTVKVSPGNVKPLIRALTQELEALQKGETTQSKTLAEIAAENMDNYFKEKETEPVYIGFDKLDDYLGGLEGGDMIVIGARPAVGKSAFVTQIARNLARKHKRVGFYNLEMQNKQVYERFVVNESGIGLTRLRKAIKFLGDEKERFDRANEMLAKADNIIITSTGSKTVGEIKAESRHMDYDIIIIDYLQLLKAESTYRGNRAAEVGEISRAVKNMAMELNIPVVALSQLNRASEGRDNREPSMAELREAGNIEQDASVIMLLWNVNEEDKSLKGCKIEKNRQGECGKVILRFNGDTMNFVETDETVKSANEWKKAADDNPFA
ncbi:MAG: AAA family ATPase [Bacteroidaceae bacterium]|nr:AAA family ATPase [Bacteroidaceae bacterium]